MKLDRQVPADENLAAIEAAAGKLRLDAVFADGVAASGFEPLPIDFEHAAAAVELPSLAPTRSRGRLHSRERTFAHLECHNPNPPTSP